LDDVSFEQTTAQRGSMTSVNLSVATVDSSSSSSGFSLSTAKVIASTSLSLHYYVAEMSNAAMVVCTK
jgi:hypothetical protein